MDIGIQPATIPTITKVNVVHCWIFQEILLVVMVELGIGLRPFTVPPEYDTVWLTVQDMEIGLKR